MDEQTRETALQQLMLATVGVVWSKLTDDEKATLHLVATSAGRSLAGTCVEESAARLATGPGKTLHKDTAAAVEVLAAQQHREAGRL